MSYLVFARKFRPQLFEEVVGQEHITTTLKNAIKKGRIAQSFLFSGSRGVGKTSTARILAKALNCEKGAKEEPCNKCTSCEEISRCTSLDVLEVDGASNRGIDEIRTLRENVKFKPAHGRYKIYIIDEVHMLTGEAFNALLKTLEEPPDHVKFIFATTEPHKVPLTILSRCQRFHFKRLSTSDIHAKLKEISKKEKIKANERILYLIAKSAEGSLRDGEGLLDQLASFSDGEIKEEDVLFTLGLTSNEVYSDLINALQGKKSPDILRLVHELVESGKDLEQLMKGLLERFRDILVLTIGKESGKWVEQDEETLKELESFSKSFTREELFLILSLLQQCIREIRWSKSPRFLTELSLLKVANRSDIHSIQEILSELKKVAPSTASNFSVNTQASAPKFEDKKKEFRNETPSAKPNFKEKSPDHIVSKSTAQDKTITLNDVERAWPDLLTQTKAKKMSIGIFLSEAEPIDVTNNRITFGFPGEFKFHKETIEQPNNKSFVCDILAGILQANIGVDFVVTEAEQTEKISLPEPPTSPADHDVISSALEIFDGSKVIRKV